MNFTHVHATSGASTSGPTNVHAYVHARVPSGPGAAHAQLESAGPELPVIASANPEGESCGIGRSTSGRKLPTLTIDAHKQAVLAARRVQMFGNVASSFSETSMVEVFSQATSHSLAAVTALHAFVFPSLHARSIPSPTNALLSPVSRFLESSKRRIREAVTFGPRDRQAPGPSSLGKPAAAGASAAAAAVSAPTAPRSGVAPGSITAAQCRPLDTSTGATASAAAASSSALVIGTPSARPKESLAKRAMRQAFFLGRSGGSSGSGSNGGSAASATSSAVSATTAPPPSAVSNTATKPASAPIRADASPDKTASASTASSSAPQTAAAASAGHAKRLSGGSLSGSSSADTFAGDQPPLKPLIGPSSLCTETRIAAPPAGGGEPEAITIYTAR